MPDTLIQEPIPEPVLPRPVAVQPIAHVDGQPAATANAQQEYVAAGALSGWLSTYYQTLPKFLDDVERQIGADTYDRMLTDPQVFCSLHILKQAVTSQDLQLAPAVPEADADYEQAKEYMEFCERCVQRLPNLRTGFLYEMLDAIPYGHRLAEQVYEIATTGVDAGKLVLAALKVKPRTSYAFVVDAFLNIVGILGFVPGIGYSSLAGIFGYSAESLAQTPNLLPRHKFAILSMLTKSGDPRGSSWFRAAYNSWFLKQQVFPDLSRYLAQFASPSIYAVLPQNAAPTPQLDSNGDPVLDSAGNPIINDPTKAMTTALLAYHNGTALVVPYDTKISTLFTYQNGEAFRFAIDLFNHEINQSILFQSLATMEAQYGSRAASQTHQDVLELPIQYARTCTEEMFRRDVLANLIRLNFGEDAVRLTPKASLGDTAEQNFNQKAVAYARLFQAGALDAEQLPEMDSELGLGRRPQQAVDRRVQEREAAIKAIEQAQMQPVAPGKVPVAATEAVPAKETQADVRA